MHCKIKKFRGLSLDCCMMCYYSLLFLLLLSEFVPLCIVHSLLVLRIPSCCSLFVVLNVDSNLLILIGFLKLSKIFWFEEKLISAYMDSPQVFVFVFPYPNFIKEGPVLHVITTTRNTSTRGEFYKHFTVAQNDKRVITRLSKKKKKKKFWTDPNYTNPMRARRKPPIICLLTNGL